MRRGIGALIAVIAILAALALAGVPVYVVPPSDDVAAADLAYVIGPPTEQRVALARQLQSGGVVRDVLISVPEAGGQSAAELSACSRPHVTCGTPAPLSTKGEVAMLLDYVRAHPTDEIIVVTFAPHVARTRFILEKCFPGEAAVMAVPQQLRPEEWVYQYLYQTAAFVKAAVTPC